MLLVYMADDLKYYFNSILTKGRKDNTYKFALARFLIDYAHGLDDAYIKKKLMSNEREIIPYSVISKAFLKYYWHQVCKYMIRQNPNLEKLPLVVQILHTIFGNQYRPETFESIKKEKIVAAEKKIEKVCFVEVIPRFQNLKEGISVTSKKIFFDYHDNLIEVMPEALQFFKENYLFLYKTVILEWAKFLEKLNDGLPRLISKIEGQDPSRKSLQKLKMILGQYFDRCFYCNNLLPIEKNLIHVDHCIPWSYIFEDEIWNLVLSCRKCNLKKHSSLPNIGLIKILINRNKNYRDGIDILKKSLAKLETAGNQEGVIMKHYQNCKDYGFTVVNL
jgi:hypothetical protein